MLENPLERVIDGEHKGKTGRREDGPPQRSWKIGFYLEPHYQRRILVYPEQLELAEPLEGE